MCCHWQGLAKEKMRSSTEQGMLYRFKPSLHYPTFLNPGLTSPSLSAVTQEQSQGGNPTWNLCIPVPWSAITSH